MDRTKITTPKGIAEYPKLAEPDTKFVKEGEYSIRVRLDTNEPKVAEFLAKIEAATEPALAWAREQLQAQLDAAKAPAKKGELKRKMEELSAAPSLVKPVYDEDGSETNEVQVRFKCKAQFLDAKTQKVVKVRPAVVDGFNNVLDATRLKIGGGSTVKVGALMYPYYNAKDNVAGVTFRLQVVKIIKLVEFGGNAAAAYFADDDEDDEDAEDLTGRMSAAAPASDDDASEAEGSDAGNPDF